MILRRSASAFRKQDLFYDAAQQHGVPSELVGDYHELRTSPSARDSDFRKNLKAD